MLRRRPNDVDGEIAREYLPTFLVLVKDSLQLSPPQSMLGFQRGRLRAAPSEAKMPRGTETWKRNLIGLSPKKTIQTHAFRLHAISILEHYMETAFSLTAEVPPSEPEYSATDDQPQEPSSLPESIEEQVKRGLFLYQPDEFVNIRVLLDNDRMLSEFSKDKRNLARFVARIDNDPEIKAIYVQLQVLNPMSLKDVPKGKGVKRHHVSRYRWFVIDIDTLRPNKAENNATEEEKEHSLLAARAVSLHLQKLGWPEPVFCDSGNGWHLVWKIDLSNTQEHYQMLRSCLLALSAKFDNEHAEIDCSLAEPEQIIKLWGTMVRKGENTPLRPWRRSSVMTMPGSIESVPFELLQQLASEAPAKSPRTTAKKSGYPQLDADFDPEHFFEWCEENLPREYQDFFARDADVDRDDADGHHRVVNTTVENLIKSGTIEPLRKVEEDEDGKKHVETNTNRIKLRDWKKQ